QFYPPHPTTRRATDACPTWGREKRKGESGQGFGAHKRHCSSVVADPQEEAPVRKAAVRASPKASLQMRPAPKPPVAADDPDFDPELDEDMPNAFSRESRRTPVPTPPPPAPTAVKVACET